MKTSERAPPLTVRGLQRLRRYFGARLSRVAVLAGRHPLAVGALGSLLALGAFALTLVTLAAGRQDALDRARDTSHGAISILSNDVQHNFELADISLQAVATGLRDPLVMQLDADIRHKVLFDRTTTAHEISAVSALDANGNVVEYGADAPPKANLADRDYFYEHRQHRDLGLYFSKPYHSRLRGDAGAIALSRRIDNADGSFAGVAVVAVSLDYFQALLDKLVVSPHSVRMIVRADGTIVARSPQITGSKGFFTVRSAPLLKLLQSPSGSFSGVSPIDGIARLYTFARIPGTPLIAVIAPAEHDVLAEWQRRSEIVGASALLVCGTFIVVIWVLAFALRDRGAIQSRLEHMAQTDSLTGLNNRRALDRVLLTEWQRMQRTGRELSVLFIDADQFKRYNDQHGHALGDLALQRIAAVLARHLKRPGDSAARYGGEEFVAILPDTDERGALNIAEAIRREIEVCHSADAKRRIPAVTVSIGCGTARQGRDTSLDAFMRRADTALYVANTSGRNRVAAAGSASL
jgi:diguanylate cyclase (GGDEF)-like protein